MPLQDNNFKRLFELSGDAMMLLGRDSFLHCNPATLNIFACPDVELFCTKHPSDVSPPHQPCGTPSWDLASRHIDDAIRHGHKRFEWVHRRLTGEDFYADVLLSPAIWQGEEVIQAIVRDISSYKALQDILQREKEQSELATRAKSEFLAIMSHEIRTPIHGILGAQELLQESHLSNEQRELVELATDSTKQLLHIVNDVLDFSKIDAGKLVLEELDFSPPQLLGNVGELFKLEAADKAIDLVLDSDDSDSRFVSDPHRIQQILGNLIANAIKFTPRNGKVTVTSRIAETGDQRRDWHITVTDTGIGMTEEQQRAAFDAFIQADSSISRNYGGTGLGLSISRALAELLGGSLEVSSALGEGSTFTLHLPLDPATGASKTQPPQPRDRQRRYDCTGLVAEDNPTNQFIIRKKLSRLGITPVIVNNGLEALEQYEKSLDKDGNSLFDVILMDIQMPVMNGIDTARELRFRHCKLPILALTADVQVERKQQCLEAGMQAFIGKPFEESKLIALFDHYLSGDSPGDNRSS